MAVSQGEAGGSICMERGKTFFRHDHALQGISLSIASLIIVRCVDGTQYDISFIK